MWLLRADMMVMNRKNTIMGHNYQDVKGENMDNINQLIGEMIRDARKQHGLNQRDFASKLALTQDAISDLEKGIRILKITELFEIARVLNIPASNFLVVNETEAKQKLLDSCIKKLNKLPIKLLEVVDIILARFAQLKSWVEDPDFGLRQLEIDLNSPSMYPSERSPDIILSGTMILKYKREQHRKLKGLNDAPDS